MPLAVLTVATWTGTLGFGFLHQWPLLLIALSPRTMFCLFAARHAEFVPWLAVAGLRGMVADPFNYRIGTRAAHRVPRWARGRFGRTAALAAVGCWPVNRHLIAAGALGIRSRWVAAADVIGTITTLSVMYRIGRAV